MNTNRQTVRRWSAAARKLLGTVLVVWTLGVVYTPAASATTPTVTVDQQPVTLQPVIPPNVTLMLDDSGSMNWDVMPDYSYLGATPGSPTAAELTSSSVNGAYYNPTITYSPPPQVNGTLYPASSFNAAPIDGFHTSNGTVDLSSYTGANDSSNNNTCYAANAFCAPSNITYSQSFNVQTAGTPYAPINCQAGYTLTNGTCVEQPYTASCPFNYTLQTSGKNSGLCVSNKNKNTTATPTCQGKDTYSSTTFLCTPNPVLTAAPTCNGSDKLNSSTGLCTPPSTTTTYSFFTYTVKNSDGTFTSHYVGNSGTCLLAASAGMTSSNCDDSATTETNVANWYSYYHTRILMAKSGLITAFNTVGTTFRVGFASINGNNTSGLPSLQYAFNDSGAGGGNSKNALAEVQPFGDGTSGTQKASFWTWILGESAGGGTPLRTALDRVGQYYQTSQPWTVMKNDPLYGTTNQPSTIACRQSYTILTTDGFWNDSYSSSSEAGASSAAWPTINGPNGLTWPTVAGSSPAAPYSGGATSDSSPSLADVAMYYWENDLQTGTGYPNEVPTNSEDPAFWQHMTTFTMGLGFTPQGISGKASNNDSPPTVSDVFSAADGGLTLTNFKWPTPAANSIYNIADLEHAGVNGHGGFYSATSPATFISGLTDALQRASERAGTGASLAANSTQLTSGTVAYQANYFTVKWTGDLKALAINSTTGAISTTPTWSAAAQLTDSSNTVNTYSSRTIETYVPSTSGAGTFVAFQNNGTTGAPPALSSAQLASLGSSAAAQATMVSYLRGDNTLEQKNNGNYRDRTSVLGDIVDSQPVYAGAPNPNEFEGQSFTGISSTATTGDNSFGAWAQSTVDASGNAVTNSPSARETLVFVAANDGMLHAFDATTGAEKFAYLPGAVIAAGGTTTPGNNIASLADPNYGTTTLPHVYFNDGELTIADAYLPGLATINGYAWHTILVGTTGRGPAEAVYALDITDPSNITPLWERSAGDGLANSNYIGQMVGKPTIAKVQDGTNSDWQVLIGNGYNSAAGSAGLLEFDLATGTLSVHSASSRISTAANGLAAPVAWMDSPSNGISTEAYAGDLQGQVWRFPLGATKGNNYNPDPSVLGTVSTTGTVVFDTPLDSSGNPQPITAGMLAGEDPNTANVWVFFGTGQYLSSNDLSNQQIESWYGVIAQPGGSSSPTSNATVSSLVQRSIIYQVNGDPTATPPTLGQRAVTPMPTPSDMSGKLGWYMNLEAPTGTNGALVAQGERMVTPNQFQGNVLLGTTRIPVVTDICNPSGSGWVMAVDPFTGTDPANPFFLGGGGTVTFTYGGKTVTMASAGVGFSALPNNPIFVGGDMLMSFDNGSTSSLMTSGSTANGTRVSWQEVVNQ
ncbi:PilC/PilY family type IV pilus protein [Dyella sp. 2HG41-7]|uniref:pilus assembly protein n=1 Tax=Dyella sp. 2HG41-7 TaxID=2883239 RepID=UPI001F16540A|nr:PilC/PilY family type IV pilus protein [Dyella sp. 2HG41-7]